MNVRELPDGVLHIDVRAADWSDAVPRVAEAWPVVAGAVARFVRENSGRKWDRLRAYVRFGSGLVWFSADPQRPRRNANVAGVKLECLESLYYTLPDPQDAERFDRAHDDMSRRTYEALRRSALLPGPRAALQALRPHPITYVEYDDLETERTLVTAADLAGD